MTLVMLNEDWHDGQDWGGEGWWWGGGWERGGGLTEEKVETVLDDDCDGRGKERPGEARG